MVPRADMKFNAVLRAQSKDPHLVSQCNEICRGNKYATSIHATNSCVLKLSKLTVACKVYRGIKVRERPAPLGRVSDELALPRFPIAASHP